MLHLRVSCHFLPWIPDCASELFTFLQAAFSAELLNPTLCQEGLVVEMSGGCTLWGLSSVSRASGKVSLVSSSWLGCCAGKMCGFGSCDMSMCTQHRTFKNGLLYFFQNLVEGSKLPTSFCRKEGIYRYIQYHPVLSWLQIISVFATLHDQAKSEPESLNSRVLWELGFLDGSLVSYCSWSLSKCKPRRWSLPIINSKAGTKS